ncbi:MAG: curlin repeat-containing protein [Hyphomicrobiales bacterium]|nr:curlin repeat-containing protein [Hyphomicrobiales bacterium]
MKTFIVRIAAAALCAGGALAAAPANAGSAPPGFTISPGKVVYAVKNPQVDLYAAVQVGGGSISVNQDSAYNVSSVTQVGPTVSATITQHGTRNTAVATQVGRHSTVSIVQFGPPVSALND